MRNSLSDFLDRCDYAPEALAANEEIAVNGNGQQTGGWRSWA